MGYPDTFKIPVSDTRAYRLFAASAVVPVVHCVAELMMAKLNLQGVTQATANASIQT
jgi:DNA (cytosine-5)-methyltransferase 1